MNTHSRLELATRLELSMGRITCPHWADETTKYQCERGTCKCHEERIDLISRTIAVLRQPSEPGVSLPEPAATDETNISADAAPQAADSLMAFARWQYTSEGSDYWVDAERRLRLYAAMRSPETKDTQHE